MPEPLNPRQPAHFFVSTPLQYLCAIEARLAFNLTGSCHLYVPIAMPSIANQIATMSRDHSWCQRSFRRPLFPSSWVPRGLQTLSEAMSRRGFADRSLRSIQPDHAVFIGNVVDQPGGYIARKVTGKNSILLLDDGMATVTLPAEIGGHNNRTPMSPGSFIHRLVFGRPFTATKPIGFFSAYPGLELGSHSFRENHFDALAESASSGPKSPTDEVVFIGQPLVKMGMLTDDAYNRIVGSVHSAAEERGLTFRYLAHRAEDTDFYPEYWRAASSELPVEVLFARSVSIPKHFVTLYSTAVYNLQRVLPPGPTFHFIRPPGARFNPKTYAKVDLLFAYLTEHASWAVLHNPDYADLDSIASSIDLVSVEPRA